MTTEDDFQQQLDVHPDDWQTRLVFADWLQERGDERAEGYRALGTLRRVPTEMKSRWHYHYNDDERFRFHFPQECFGYPYQSQKDLPKSWHHLLFLFQGAVSCPALTRREAEDAAALAFVKLPAERRAELLALPAEVKS